MLFLCKKAKEVWENLGLYEVVKKVCGVDCAGEAVLEVLLLIPEHELAFLGSHNTRKLIAITAWYLWWNRRQFVHEGKVQDASQTSMGILAIASNYIKTYSPKAKRKSEGWSKPSMGFVKLNVDASFDHDQLRGTTGAVIRDDRGNFIVGGNNKIECCLDALTAEALALRFGLYLAHKTGCNHAIINSDNMEVIDTMKNGGHSAGPAQQFLRIIFFWLVTFRLLGLSTLIEKRTK